MRRYTFEDVVNDAHEKYRATKEGRLEEWLAADKVKRAYRERVRELTRQIAMGCERRGFY